MRKLTVLAVALALMASSTAAFAQGDFGEWEPAQLVGPADYSSGYQTAEYLEGCPFISRDGKKMFLASNRPVNENDTTADLNIWVATRRNANAPWGPAVEVGPPVNSEFNDFCPTLAPDGHTFYFVSNRPGHCGATQNGDIYVTRTENSAFSGSGPFFTRVRHLDCDEEGGPNSPSEEASPFPILEPGNDWRLYYSSTRTGAGDIYFSELIRGSFGRGQLVQGTVNTPGVEGHPNVRRDGREIFFFRATPTRSNDIYSASRASTSDPWSNDMNLGPNVNSDASETRPSLSWDGHTLYFGSTRTGAGDHYFTTR